MLHTPNPELLEQISWLIPHLPRPAPFTIRGEADYYGASHEIARAIGLETPPISSGTWRHGWSRFPSTFPEMAATYKPGTRVHLMPDAHHERLLLDAGYPNALAVGYPLLYASSADLARRQRSLLAAPFHLLPEITPPAAQLEFEHAFAEYLRSQRAHFDTVCACLHVSCIEHNLWTRTLEQHGIPWVLGAMTNDANALSRVRTLFQAFDCVVTNHIGSVMPYAAHLGARVCIAGPAAAIPDIEAFARHPTYQKHPKALENIKRLQNIPLSEDVPFLLCEPAQADCPKTWADEAVGASHQIPVEGIARLLGWRHSRDDAPSLTADSHRRLLVTLGSTPPALSNADDREKLGRVLNNLQQPVSEAVGAVIKERDQLKKSLKPLLKQMEAAKNWPPVRRSLTWRLLGRPLFALERLLRPSLRKAPSVDSTGENSNSH